MVSVSGSFVGGCLLPAQRVYSPEQTGGPWLWGCQEQKSVCPLMLWLGESLPTWLPGTERQGAAGAHFRFNLGYSPTLVTPEGLRSGYLSPDVEKPLPLGVKKCL